MSGLQHRLLVQGLRFGFRERWLFSDWNTELAPGLHWLRGTNGSGKSSLLRLLAGVLEPARGQREIDGLCARRQALAYRRELFWVGPERLGFDHLSSLEFFAFLTGLYTRWSAARLAEARAGLHLDEAVCAQRLAALSSGTQRKVWLAAGLAAGTALLLLDEPWNALDADSATWLYGCAERRDGRIWLVASHQAPCAKPDSVLDLSA